MLSFSIITCTWNSAATLADTIRSVQSQDWPTVEHIFVDGGSTDGTLELIERMSPGSLVLHGVRGGISRAMNAGASAATGDVVAHLHSDDYYYTPDVLKTVSDALERTGRAWAYGRLKLLGEDGSIRDEAPDFPRFTFWRYAAQFAGVPHPAAFIRRTAFEEMGGFDESLRYAMDIDMWLRLGRRHLPVQIPKHLAVFREHHGSLSHTNSEAAGEEALKVRRRYAREALFALPIYEARLLSRRVRQILRG